MHRGSHGFFFGSFHCRRAVECVVLPFTRKRLAEPVLVICNKPQALLCPFLDTARKCRWFSSDSGPHTSFQVYQRIENAIARYETQANHDRKESRESTKGARKVAKNRSRLRAEGKPSPVDESHTQRIVDWWEQQIEHLRESSPKSFTDAEEASPESVSSTEILSLDALQNGLPNAANALLESVTQEDAETVPRLDAPFVDFIEVHVSAGDGGWQRRGSYRSPKGNGAGYGGNGSDVILVCSEKKDSLDHISSLIVGKNGEDAWETHRGLHALPTLIEVPLGSILRQRCKLPLKNAAAQKKKQIYAFWYQFLKPGEQVIVAQAGRGGMGKSVKGESSRNPGKGEKKRLQLELRLVNDAVLVGFPNSGKTSVAASMTQQCTHIGPEEFTTTRPYLSQIRYRDGVEIVLLDLPAVFCGANKDALKGRRTLRHIYRAKLIIYVLDVANTSDHCSRDLLKEFETLRREIREYHPANKEKRELIVGTKCDMLHRDALYNLDSLYFRLKARYPEIPLVGVSARFGLNIATLTTMIRQLVYPDMMELTSRVFQRPLEDVMAPSLKDIQKTIERLNSNTLPPTLHVPCTGGDPSTFPPLPVTTVHPSYLSMQSAQDECRLMPTLGN